MSVIDLFDYFSQLVITVTGCSAMYLLASQDPRTRMYAGIIGFAGEPFWLATALINEQWGIVALVFVYGVNWARVAYSNYVVLEKIKLKRYTV